MAQAPQKDIQAIINEAAAKEGVDAELLRKIGGAESSFKPNVKNSKSTAKGLFGFLDSSWKEMGGKPGEQFIPEKNAELGAKLTKKNVQALSAALGREPSHGEVYAAHFFGTTGAKTLLTKADPNAPIEQALAMFESPKRVKKVLQQNPNLQGKTTGEVIAQLNAKMGVKQQPSPAAQEPAKSGPGFFRSPVPHFIRSEAPNLGTGYNAALALMGMSDEDDPVAKAQETLAQNEEDNSVADFGQAKQMLTSLQAPNAFANQQPRMLARGGQVKRRVDPDEEEKFRVNQFNTFRPDDTQWLANTNDTLQKYKTAAEAYDAAVNKYNAEVYQPYKAKVDAYNAAPMTQATRGNPARKTVAAPGPEPAAFTMAKPTDPGITEQMVKDRIAAMEKSAVEDAEGRSVAISVANRPRSFNLAGFGMAGINAPSMFKKGGEAKSEDSESEHDKQASKFFDELSTYGQDISVRPSFSVAPSYTNEPGVGFQTVPTTVQGKLEAQLPLWGGQASAAVSGTAVKPQGQKLITMPGDVSLGYSREAGPHTVNFEARRSINPMPTPGGGRGHMYGANVNYKYQFADGGDVAAPEPEKGSAKAMLKEVGRSTQYAPADIAGSPVDLVNLGLKGVDAMTGSKLAQEMPVGGSEWIIEKAHQLGLMDKPTGSTTENVTRMAMGVVSPTAGPRAMVAAGKAVKGTAKAALEDISMAATGQGGSNIAQKFATATGIEPKFASRPKGGVSLGASSAADVPLTRVDETLKQTIEGLDTNTEQGQAVASFFDKKMRNYYQNQHGTADDPLYKAILEGRLTPALANPRVVDAARAGDPDALKNLRRAYDASTNIQALSSKTVLKGQGRHQFDMEGDVRKLIEQQSPGEDTLMASAVSLDPKELEKYSTLYGPKGFKDIVSEGEAGKLLRLLNKTDLQPHVRQAVAKGEPIYAMAGGTNRMLPVEEIKDYLFTRTPAEIKNMGVVDAAVKAKQWHIKMAEARKNPEKFGRKELFSGTEPVLPMESGTWVDVKTPDALSLEGNIMGHCVGGSNYCNAVSQDKTKIISLRDKKGIPHVTIQLEKTPEGFTRVAQIKGTANNSPEKYFGEINAFLDDYSSKLGKNLTITERPSFVPPQWRDK